MGRAKFPQLSSIPKEHINDVYNYLMDMNTSESGFNFRALKLRPVFSDRIYPLVFTIFFYALLVFFGLCGNGTVFYVIWKRASYKKYNTLACVLNMTTAFFIQLVFVIPLTLFVLVVDNWVLGSGLCHLLPMIQDIPGYSLMMTIAILSYDRRRFLSNPRKGTMPLKWAIGLSWIISFCLVLPYIGYIVFIDLSVLGPEFVGGQICIISLPGKASTYIKTLFIFFYAIPMLTSIAFLRRTSRIIRRRELEQIGYRSEGTPDSEYIECNRYYSSQYWYDDYYENQNGYTAQQPKSRRKNVITPDSPFYIDVQKEKRSQKFLYLIIITYFICLFPLNVLKLVRQMIMETYDNSSDFDVTYTIIVWVAFLPTVFLPWYFAQWIFLGDDISSFRFYISTKSGSGLSFPGLSQPPTFEEHAGRIQRTPTPPPPPGSSYPKKKKNITTTNSNNKIKNKASRSSSSSSIGGGNLHQQNRSVSLRSTPRVAGKDDIKCTCRIRTRTQQYSKESLHHRGRKKASSSSLQVYEKSVSNKRRHSYNHLKYLDEDYQTLAVPSQLKKRSHKNWSVSMYGLSATQV